DRDPGRGADSLDRARPAALQRPQDALAAGGGARQVGLGHQHGELVAAGAAGDVSRAGLGLQHAADLAQDAVGRGVSVAGPRRPLSARGRATFWPAGRHWPVPGRGEAAGAGRRIPSRWSPWGSIPAPPAPATVWWPAAAGAWWPSTAA